jgi:hypothetical protein
MPGGQRDAGTEDDPQMTQIYADKTVFHLRPSASSADEAFHQPPGQAIASANPAAADSSAMWALAMPS